MPSTSISTPEPASNSGRRTPFDANDEARQQPLESRQDAAAPNDVASMTSSSSESSTYTPAAVAAASHKHTPDTVHSYLYPSQERPLIERVTNEWQNSPQYSRYQDDDYDEDEYGQLIIPRWSKKSWTSSLYLYPRRTFRYLALYVLFLFLCLYYWKSWSLQPSASMADEELLDASMYKTSMPGREYGTNARPDFTGLKQIQYLDSKFVPGASHASKKRLIAVGDVHGCKEELAALLKKLSFDQKHDHLVLTGDIVFKGPDSGGVIDLARSLGASCVRGNHDDRTLLAYASLHSKALPASAQDKDTLKSSFSSSSSSSSTSSSSPLSPPPSISSHGDIKHLALAKTLTPSQIHWLQQCPCVLNIGPIGSSSHSSPSSSSSSSSSSTFSSNQAATAAATADYVVVHAGLAPGIPLHKQDPYAVMNMRSIDPATRVPSDVRAAGTPWEVMWNHYQMHQLVSSPSTEEQPQQQKQQQQRKTVIYGHDSKTGLNLQRYSRGLDSGCVRGGRLTALVIDARGKEKVVSVKCRNSS